MAIINFFKKVGGNVKFAFGNNFYNFKLVKQIQPHGNFTRVCRVLPHGESWWIR